LADAATASTCSEKDERGGKEEQGRTVAHRRSGNDNWFDVPLSVWLG
jgi:hypothetical protein